MKFATAYYLLFFYVAALFKPVLPFVSDFLAHTFTTEDHLSTVHHKHGAGHAHLQMAEIAGEANDEQRKPDTKFSEPVPVHLISQQAYHFAVPVIAKQNYFTSFCKTSDPFQHIIVPPPKH